ncbi:MAG TPA: MFS transporter [Candidatus Hydrogenedentes bacterium]|nr:MFS transporter [Candidatus Hydrogenedentota bacterium]HPG69535.1 MFS transporter [Candidatus Hydrogenedentota bacterium]
MRAREDSSTKERIDYDRRGFWALIVTLFQGAFNDNAYRWIITYHLFRSYIDPATGTPSAEKAASITALGAILFSVPYIVFPGLAGALSDRYSKRTITIATKVWEVMVMTLGLVAFWLEVEPVIWFLLFLMNMQSAFFSPSKYGILPEILPESRLSWGNGVLNMATFVAIITGTACAGVLFDREFTIYAMSGVLILLSLIGLTASLFVSRVPAADPGRRIPLNPWSGMRRPLEIYRKDNVLFLMLIIGSFFWFAGALVQQNVPVFGRVTLGLSELAISIMIAIVGIGIGAGSLAAGYLSRRRIELGLVPLGMAGVAVLAILLAMPWGNTTVMTALLFLLGFSSGVYVVPVNAMVQYRSPGELKGGMIAAFNLINCIGILLAGALYMGGGKVDITPRLFFLITGALTVALVVYLCIAFPTFLLRLGFWVLTNTIYRLRVKGAENVPERGGALIVADMASCVDALTIVASIDRPVYFCMPGYLFGPRVLRPLRQMLGLKPKRARGIMNLAQKRPASIEAHLAAARRAIKSGKLVCVFATGQVAPSGDVVELQEFLDTVMQGIDAPIIPVFVRPTITRVIEAEKTRIRWTRPPFVPFPLVVSYAEPLPPDAPRWAITSAIMEAGTRIYDASLWPHRLLHRAFIRAARKYRRVMAMADVRTPGLSYFKALVASIILGRKLRDVLGGNRTTGILVPPSVGGALTNIALQMMGRVPVNLNYTASAETMAAAARQAEIEHVITSKAFLERLPLEVPGNPVYLEDIMASVTKKDRIIAALIALLVPVKHVESFLGAPPNRSEHDLATIIFSSGSEGEPKGVMLTHLNIMSNIDTMATTFDHRVGHPIMGILPFFHSFGFTVTLWAGLIEGVGGVFHPNPLEARAIGGLIEKYRAHLFIATPTFLQNFIRRCSSESMRSLAFVLTGAEKLPDRVRDAFTEKFGIVPFEGYGVTECAPVISADLPVHHLPGCHHCTARPGTIGRAMPGVAVRTVHPETREPVPAGEPGVLLVRGPNVMKGYLGMPEKTASVLHDGWYETGDIVSIDEDGFITITDRLARFSKVGGEMVPHIKVEEALHDLLGLTEQALAVAAVPDVAKGERLVVLHTLDDDQIDSLLGMLDKAGLPNLWRPRANAFYRVDAIPVLGTGKMDIRAVKNLARKLDIGE